MHLVSLVTEQLKICHKYAVTISEIKPLFGCEEGKRGNRREWIGTEKEKKRKKIEK